MRTVTGGVILQRLMASMMQDEMNIKKEELNILLDTYNNGFPDIVGCIYSLLRASKITDASSKTITLARLAIEYFSRQERTVEMNNIKQLYITCPRCGTLMNFDRTKTVASIEDIENGDSTIYYKCGECGEELSGSPEYIKSYSTYLATAIGVYDEHDVGPTPEEERVAFEVFNDFATETAG